jgi:hypothetical protein
MKKKAQEKKGMEKIHELKSRKKGRGHMNEVVSLSFLGQKYSEGLKNTPSFYMQSIRRFCTMYLNTPPPRGRFVVHQLKEPFVDHMQTFHHFNCFPLGSSSLANHGG